MTATRRGGCHAARTGRDGACGRVSARELVEHSLKRIERDNPPLNAVIALRAEEALAEADALDERVGLGEPTALELPLLGVPLLVKDVHDLAGMRTTIGSLLLADAPPARRDCAHIAPPARGRRDRRRQDQRARVLLRGLHRQPRLRHDAQPVAARVHARRLERRLRRRRGRRARAHRHRDRRRRLDPHPGRVLRSRRHQADQRAPGPRPSPLLDRLLHRRPLRHDRRRPAPAPRGRGRPRARRPERPAVRAAARGGARPRPARRACSRPSAWSTGARSPPR